MLNHNKNFETPFIPSGRHTCLEQLLRCFVPVSLRQIKHRQIKQKQPVASATNLYCM